MKATKHLLSYYQSETNLIIASFSNALLDVSRNNDENSKKKQMQLTASLSTAMKEITASFSKSLHEMGSEEVFLENSEKLRTSLREKLHRY